MSLRHGVRTELHAVAHRRPQFPLPWDGLCVALSRGNVSDHPSSARRSFLRRSAFAAGALVTAPAALGAGCGASPYAGADLRGRELLERLERGLGRVRGVPNGRIAAELSWLSQPALAEQLLRHTLETLVIADVAQSVRGGALSAPLRARMHEELPVLARTTDAHHALLSRMPPRARRTLDRRLREEPTLPNELASWIDAHAAELGTSREGRLKLRMAVRDVDARVRRQSASAVIDDCVGKVEQVGARTGAASLRAANASAMIDAIWSEVDGAGGRLSAPGASPPLRGPDPDEEWERFLEAHQRMWSARWGSPGDEEVQIGAIMMPFGAATCGLLLIIGLIVLIVGAAQNAAWDGTPRHAPR